MTTINRFIAAPLFLYCTMLVSHAQETVLQPLGSQTDEEVGTSTRAWLKEQVQGNNRGETEPYRAESAGKAYRAYTDAIGAKDQKAPASQISTISTD